ncbi:MAG: dephospho-CoA kinase [Puniceicoccaceae bacterium]|nr:MAG: dephospho-CoA kinase [Puniceicoccaceae bacterium]
MPLSSCTGRSQAGFPPGGVFHPLGPPGPDDGKPLPSPAPAALKPGVDTFPGKRVLGLTGGMGCGKSTAAGFFRDAGFATLDCDAIVRDLLAEDAEVAAEVAAAFGPEVRSPAGGVDRPLLGRRVFSDPAALQRLESILHPRVHEIWTGRIRASDQSRWVVEIPLLFEKNLENKVDLTVCVACDPEIQFDRLVRRGLSPADIRLRLNRQLPLEEKVARADFVLLNNSSPDFLRDQVNRLITAQLQPH